MPDKDRKNDYSPNPPFVIGVKRPALPLSLVEKMQRDKLALRSYCKHGGLMGLYYGSYPGEAPRGYWDAPKQSPQPKETAEAKAELHQHLTENGQKELGKLLYPEPVHAQIGRTEQPGRGGR